MNKYLLLCIVSLLIVLWGSCTRKGGVNEVVLVDDFMELGERYTGKVDGILYRRNKNGTINVRREFWEAKTIRPEWFGAIGDGIHDDKQAFNTAIAAVCEHQAKFVTGTKTYHLSGTINFPNCEDQQAIWEGNNAILNNRVIINGMGCKVNDLRIHNSPVNGFKWVRGQGGYFTNLEAKGCAKAGFLIGGESGCQVAWSTFTNIKAIANYDGIVLDGSHSKNWVNANVFTGVYARHNDYYGVHIMGKANYNSWVGLHCEGNSRSNNNLPALFIENSSENYFSGGHIVTRRGNASSAVLDRGRLNVYAGGRYVADDACPRVIDQERSKLSNPNAVRRKARSSRNE